MDLNGPAARQRRPAQDTSDRRTGPTYIGGLHRSCKTTIRSCLTSRADIAIPDVGSNIRIYRCRRYGGSEAVASGHQDVVLLSQDFVGRCRDSASAEEAACIQMRLRDAMASCGYRIDPIPLSKGERVRFTVAVAPDQFVRVIAWLMVEALQEAFPRFVPRRPGERMIVETPA